jgi:NAD(P)-dependent dehydrogenase (short-subunit alcohol dehydrogenase family)
MLDDKVILVTGAGRGIGRGIASAVAEEGGTVVVVDLNRGGLDDTVQIVEAAGGKALALQVDVTDEAAVTKMVADAVKEFGYVDGLVNSAGVLAMNPALDATPDEFQKQFDVNVRGVFLCCKAVATQIKNDETERGGAIVNVASNAGKVWYPNMAPYNASKAAVINLTRTLAAEWSEYGINVNAVCPGGVDTPMLGDVAGWVGQRTGENPDELLGTMKPMQLGRHIEPIEVGRVVAFLLSERAAIIRGQSINVDGGDTPY